MIFFNPQLHFSSRIFLSTVFFGIRSKAEYSLKMWNKTWMPPSKFVAAGTWRCVSFHSLLFGGLFLWLIFSFVDEHWADTSTGRFTGFFSEWQQLSNNWISQLDWFLHHACRAWLWSYWCWIPSDKASWSQEEPLRTGQGNLEVTSQGMELFSILSRWLLLHCFHLFTLLGY